jgi:hypothetical protein
MKTHWHQGNERTGQHVKQNIRNKRLAEGFKQ